MRAGEDVDVSVKGIQWIRRMVGTARHVEAYERLVRLICDAMKVCDDDEETAVSECTYVYNSWPGADAAAAAAALMDLCDVVSRWSSRAAGQSISIATAWKRGQLSSEVPRRVRQACWIAGLPSLAAIMSRQSVTCKIPWKLACMEIFISLKLPWLKISWTLGKISKIWQMGEWNVRKKENAAHSCRDGKCRCRETKIRHKVQEWKWKEQK